jgi:hypothetical protein
MRIALVIAICVGLAFAGEWVYRGFIRPIDPLPPELLALAEHFDRNGIEVRPYAVRHGFRHSEVLASAAFKIAGFPLPVEVILCPSEESAMERFAAVKRSPNLMHPERNGSLVMTLAMWSDDTTDMAAKVLGVFASFDSAAPPRRHD